MLRQTVSVIIPTYNSGSFVTAAVESALGQSVQPFEIIVIDDGSTDATSHVLKPYMGSIRYYQQPNAGLSAARNRGIAAAMGDLIAFLDADDIWLPNKLALQMETLEKHPEAALVHSDVYFWDNETGERAIRNKMRHGYTGRCYHQFFRRNAVCPSTVLVRRECLDRIGGFDEQIRRPTTQDYDLWWRIARRYDLAYLDRPTVLYRLHSGNASKQTLMMVEDELYVVLKALSEDSQLAQSLGFRETNDRLFGLYFSIGYINFDEGRFPTARRSLLSAIRRRPTDTYTWLLTASTLLPPAWVRALRNMKQSALFCLDPMT
ncbi:glycosyltransferase family 2 protein [Tautonia plasticadhaerens]|uniref:Chondroitin synthase n=1 Tax=Tautonia plasticadhaerens TaxID=2527974 RepID=A0A518HFT0_9BACT|nr:glycosyltransferase [Tautonia plasticadhaerens]QDV39707.1 Chondroitin synthase [Tautonia plasticadhaerens]